MDVINLLPDSVANQIAAGEVIQRPASVVKELAENAVDAKATKITLIIKNSGKQLIQVIDDGVGMSEVDARMSFERHATSKIIEANDLFALRTKGFRGEALASIAAIAHVDLKTRLHHKELGTQIIMEGSKVISQEPCNTHEGTSFSVKNLFYNVPARRKFLKSDQVEMKHILEEFQRLALAHPDISFELLKDEGVEVFNLPAGTLRQRVVGIFGKSFNEKLVPIEEQTDIISITGFIGKPEAARKTRGMQYLFLNDRFIKSPYLHHAIMRAYQELLVEKTHPSYFFFMNISPERVDVNIHPTKTEVKFEDEKALYAIISSAVRRSLGKYNIAPSIDFEQETSFNVPPLEEGQAIKIPEIRVDRSFNPFEKTPLQESSPTVRNNFKQEEIPANWAEMFEASNQFEEQAGQRAGQTRGTYTEEVVPAEEVSRPHHAPLMIQVQDRYIMSMVRSGLMLIDQARAHERILYESFIQAIALNNGTSQQSLFPETMDLSAGDMEIITEFADEIGRLGFDLEIFGKQSIKINGVPAEAVHLNTTQLFEAWLEEFRLEQDGQRSKTELLARTLSRKMALAPGRRLQKEEMQDLVDRLFGCEQPQLSPGGKPIVVNISMEELNRKFDR